MVRRYFVPLQIQPLVERDFDGTVRLRSIGELDTAWIRAHPMLVTRTRKHIEHSASDEYFIALHLHGIAHAEQSGRAVFLRPGDFAVFDSARPYRIAFQAAGTFEHLIIRIPRVQLDLRVRGLDRATAFGVKAGSVPGRLATPAITSLASLDGSTPFVDPTLDLIAAALSQTPGLALPPTSRQQRTLNRLKRYTLAHLADPELSPTRVAGACFVSPRQLHRLFERDGLTFRTFVKETRLRRIHRDLADRELTGVSIGEVARRHGYRHAAALTRDFTERYGTGPRAFRRAQCEL